MADEPFDPHGPLDAGRRVLYVGTYAALDLGNYWVVYARGDDPTTNWKHDLVAEGERDGVPVLALYAEEPGLAGAAITPFIVSEVVRPRAKMLVLVRDARGTHEVGVEPPGD